MKKFLALLLSLMMLLAVLPMSVFAEETGEEVPGEVAGEVTEDPEDEELIAISEIVVDFIYPTYGEVAYTECILETENCNVTEAKWFEASSDSFMEADATFSAGTYYIEATFTADEGYAFDAEVTVVINGEYALNVTVNEDGTVTAVAEFEVEEGEEPASPINAIVKFLNTLKAIVVKIIRFFGSLVGLK